MKKIRNKIVGILLTAVMAIGGVIYSGGIVSATNEGIETFTIANPDLADPCEIDDEGNLINPRHCLNGTDYYDENGDLYPATYTASTVPQTSTHYGVGKEFSQAKLDIEQDHKWYPYKSHYDHYVVIKETGDENYITYIRCDIFLKLPIKPGEQDFFVEYLVDRESEIDPGVMIASETVTEGGKPLYIPTKYISRSGEEYSIVGWKDENGNDVNFDNISISKNTKFYAILEEKTKDIRVTYNSNETLGGTVTTATNQTKLDDETNGNVKIDNGEFENPIKEINGKNVIFIGWTEEATSQLVGKEDSEPEKMKKTEDPYVVEKDTTLYAVWATDENGNEVPDYQEGSITVNKTINKMTNIEGQGKPIFTFKLECIDGDNEGYIDYKTMTITTNNAGTVVFEGLPAGTYTISEIEGIRYDLKSINDEENSKTKDIVIPEYSDNNQKLSVSFENELMVSGNISDTGSVTNTFSYENGKVTYQQEFDNNKGR